MIVDILTPTKLDFTLNPLKKGVNKGGGYLKRRKQYFEKFP